MMAGPAGFEPATPGLKGQLFKPIIWKELRNSFEIWAKANYGQKYFKDVMFYLEKLNPRITRLEDIDAIFADKGPGWRHKWFAIRCLLKYCESHGWNKQIIEQLKAVMPSTPQSGVDKRVPKESVIIELFRQLNNLNNGNKKYAVFYNLILDSAIRPMHAVEILNSWDERNVESVEDCEGIYKYYADIERKQKHTFVVFFTEYTFRQIHENKPKLTANGYFCFKKRHNLLRPKLVQKFAYNMMRKHGVDRDVAEFLSGRKPAGVGPRHYAELITLAEVQYRKYAEYLNSLRKKIN